LSVKDKALFSRNIKRKLALMMKISNNNIFNARMLGFKLGTNTSLGKVLTAFSSISRLPD
jgi:hypothetical protein